MDSDEKRAATLAESSQENADLDPMLQAYGRYWLPHVEGIAADLRKIAAALEALAGRVEPSADGKADDDK